MAYNYKDEDKAQKAKDGLKINEKIQKKLKGLTSSSKQKDDFQPKNDGGYSSFTGKKLALIAVVVFIVAAIALGTTMIGFATHAGELETQLSAAKTDLNTTAKERDACNTNLISCAENKSALEAEYNNTKVSLSACNANLSEWKENYSDLEDDYDDLSDDYDSCLSTKNDTEASRNAWKNDYRLIINNTAKTVCCDATEINASTIEYFSVSSNSIDCSGIKNSVNCSSGVTDYTN